MSPICRLPVELLAQIFTECFPFGELDVPVLGAAALALSRVSRQWRAIAHSMPALWATFTFAEGPGSKKCPLNWAARRLEFKSFITRSGELPLSFRCCIFASFVEIDTHPILSTLFKLSHRWRNVRLSLPYLTFLDMRYRRPWSLPDLEHLILEGPRHYLDEDPPETFSVAPRLTRLSLQNYVEPTRVFSLPWSQIRHLHLKENRIEGTDYGVVLQQATNLESLVSEYNSFGQFPFPNPITCPRIKSLTVLTKKPCVDGFLESLVLPNLMHLDLRFWGFSGPEIDAAVQFLEHSGLSVVNFTCKISDDLQLFRLLDKMPHLTHVDLRGPLIRPSLVERLRICGGRPRTQTQLEVASPLGLAVNLDPESAADSDNETVSLSSPSAANASESSSGTLDPPPPCFLPRLESLLLRDDGLSPDLNGLTDAIISRIQVARESKNVSPLKRVEVLIRIELEMAATSQFKKLVETGCDKHVLVRLADRSHNGALCFLWAIC